ncbi:hypothetical protein RMSM_01366 [Rhodopirellula maiorica SM1]|uniref:Uncharacterized protein n=1 Tax=Rhodopirellula maiorica SM1 TaxID=1265738 RepID=M5RR61_9BACT|nr:hypothetical protein RMSM_01366 [Rhodopirellula maiorica SM1]
MGSAMVMPAAFKKDRRAGAESGIRFMILTLIWMTEIVHRCTAQRQSSHVKRSNREPHPVSVLVLMPL